MNPRTIQQLLDVDHAAGLVAALSPSGPAQAVTIESVWAKPGRHFNVCYRLDDGGSPQRVSLCTVQAAEGTHAMRRIHRRGIPPTSSHTQEAGEVAVALVAPDVLAQRFPLDYRLEHLGVCQGPAVVHDVLGDHSVDACEVVAYRAGMRCQMLYSAGASPRAYGKIAAEREVGRRGRVHRQLFAATATTQLRVPAFLGSVELVGLDLVAAVPGRSLHDALRDAAGTDPVARPVTDTARALAELHAVVPAPTDRVHSASDELALLESWTAWMSAVEPAMAIRRARVFGALATRLPQTQPTTFAHRDFHDKQVLLDDSCSWLLDVDTACTGDPELDVGNFLAHLFLRGLQWDRGAAHRKLETMAEDAYGDGASRDVTRWYRRASLLRLACVYQLRPHWRHVVPALLDEASVP